MGNVTEGMDVDAIANCEEERPGEGGGGRVEFRSSCGTNVGFQHRDGDEAGLVWEPGLRTEVNFWFCNEWFSPSQVSTIGYASNEKYNPV